MRTLVLVAGVLVAGACSSGNHNGSDGGGGGGGGNGGGGGGGGSSGGGPNSGQVFPSDNPWNSDISGADVDPKSAAYLASMGTTTGLHPDFDAVGDGIPFVFVPGNQKKVPVSFEEAGESDPGPYAIPDDAPIEGASDGHVIAVDFTNALLYELDVGNKTKSGWSAYSGAIFDLGSNKLRPDGWTSADAAGLPIFPGLVRYDEVITKGEINHALRFTADQTQSGYVTPARHSAGSCPVNSDCPPMGLRVRLKASVDLSKYPASVQVILRAMKKYGMFLADNGSNWYVSGEPNEKWIDDDLSQLSGIKGKDFEVVKTGTITPGL
jgi:hypothetical protein